ncbi:hypothetical protein CDD80_7355 [Ophiocordyceps camponoti-rufipedis]|uniref:ubiquitinyl hydrolase 1 n=1 Tax=Ophiocordyceps camponoti-rufipedis TaxID=2004952 RepID=A0A2C5Z8D1_9HYPO|nr:hypothetical protein CDD80_7355 [Ophiocordyceps camponoti-rufipedis]
MANMALVDAIDHIFLPPKLPSRRNDGPITNSHILKTLLSALNGFRAYVDGSDGRSISSAIYMVTHHQRMADARDESSSLLKLFQNLNSESPPIVVHVRAQNAGLIIRPASTKQTVIFEAFELTPPNEKIVTTVGRLRRTFPQISVAVPWETFVSEDFKAALASTISQMSIENAKEMGQDEITGESAAPHLVLRLLVPYLLANGKRCKDRNVTKCTRDEVSLSEVGSLAWKRSAYWTCLRVALHLQLSDGLYKRFMLFYMSTLLGAAVTKGLPSDVIHVMNAKLSRRLVKLNLVETEAFMAPVATHMTAATQLLESRWVEIIGAQSKKLEFTQMNAQDLERDVCFQLPELDSLLAETADQQRADGPSRFKPSSKVVTFTPDEFPDVSKIEKNSEYKLGNLVAFEDWVHKHLDSWLERSGDEELTCRRIKRAMETYHEVAKVSYANHPDGISAMILTVTQLWIACDKSATRLHPLLLDWDHDIPTDFFQDLSFKLHRDMQRLFDCERYLKQRSNRVARQSERSAIFSIGKPDSFSVKFVQNSQEHQDLLSKIHDWSAQMQSNKAEELNRCLRDHARLMENYATQTCDHDDADLDHSEYCSRCQRKSEADGMTIAVFENPLPSSQNMSLSVVFEMNVPSTFRCWRECTLFFLRDVLQSQSQYPPKAVAGCKLTTYQGLSQFHDLDARQKVLTLASESVPRATANPYIAVVQGLTKTNVCVSNRLDWRFFDLSVDTFLHGYKATDAVLKSCRYRLPEKSSLLQGFLTRNSVHRDGPRPNSIITQQDLCPKHLSPEEFRALGSLAWGSNKKTETTIFLLQLCEQTGPAFEDPLRQAHKLLGRADFVRAAVSKLKACLARVETNWQYFRAVWTFATIAARLLALGPVETQQFCLDILADCRRISAKWLEDLREKALSAEDNAARSEYLEKSFEVALVCLSTFDIDEEHWAKVFDEGSMTVYYLCLIRVHETQIQVRNDAVLQTLLFRAKRLARRLLPLSIAKLDESRGLMGAIKRVYDFTCHGSWKVEADCWAVNDAEHDSTHLNLLTGEILINGKPPGRLPDSYESNALFKTLFGGSRLDVTTTRGVPGMQFKTQSTIEGYQVFLNLIKTRRGDAGDLRVRMQKDGPETQTNDSTCDLVPPRVLEGALPWSFITDHVHFYHHGDRSVEFRPKKKPWEANESNWRLRKSDSSWRLTGKGLQLVGCSTPTTNTVMEVFQYLERETSINVFYHPVKGDVQVQLPRLGLDFSLKLDTDKWRCRQYRGMVIDADQGFGSLIGLRNLMVLCEEDCLPSLMPLRMVLIPEATLYGTQAFPGHISVGVNSNTVKNLQVYRIANHLGRLVGNGSLESKLLLAYLHSLTSFCLPDPLTGVTGTEQTLRILRSGEVRSFNCLSAENLDRLHKIASLTPKRCFKYDKKKEKESETGKKTTGIEPTRKSARSPKKPVGKGGPVGKRELPKSQVEIVAGWNSELSPLSQHPDLVTVVEEITKEAKETGFLNRDAAKISDWSVGNRDLMERFSIRASAYYNCSLTAENQDVEYDYWRDREFDGKRSDDVLAVCSILRKPESPELRMTFKPADFNKLKKVFGSERVSGTVKKLPSSAFQYGARWLDHPETVFPDIWLSIHKTLGHDGGTEINRFNLMMWISAIAFAEESKAPLVRALLGFARFPAVREIQLPTADFFDLSQSEIPTKLVMRRELKKALRGVEMMEEQGYSRSDARGREIYKNDGLDAVETLMVRMSEQWSSNPGQVATLPQNSHNTLKFFDQRRALRSLKDIFSSCADNRNFGIYSREIDKVMKNLSPALDLVDNPSLAIVRPIFSVTRRPVRCITITEALKGVTPATVLAMKNEVAQLQLEVTNIHQELRNARSEDLNDVDAAVFDLSTWAGEKASRKSEEQYADALQNSLESLREQGQAFKLAMEKERLLEVLERQLSASSRLFDRVWNLLVQTAGRRPRNANQLSSITVVATTNHWPRFTVSTVLEQLSLFNRELLSPSAREAIKLLAMTLSDMQQAKRMMRRASDEGALLKEIQSFKAPASRLSSDELLLEVEQDLRIWPEQQEMAANMKKPKNNENSSFQLHMGGGKSSVILPMVAAAIADGSRLARVVVAKPQSRQMLETLIPAVGGLMGRRIWHLPFTRALKISKAEAQTIKSMCEACKREGGILVVRPEHILSLQLMTILRHVTDVKDGRPYSEVGAILGDTLAFLNEHGRDIIDESDENFSPKFELIYTMGKQRPIEFAPDRWVISQQVLGLVARFASQVKEEMPDSIEVVSESGRFPRIRLINEKANRALCQHLAEAICQHGLQGLALGRQPENLKEDMKRYLTEVDVDKSVTESVERALSSESTKNGIWLLRGLMAGGLLWFAFGRKRWTVDFGLDSNRKPSTRLAVPYRAKDTPSSSDFCNPDIQILLTCLCYYYGGVPDDDLLLSLQQLSKSEAAAGDEYSHWVSDCSGLPDGFRSFESLNLRDRKQCSEEVFPKLKYSKGAVDYFLSNLVFPLEIRGFPQRLSASGWDIGREKANLTTAFSGTVDSQHLLPLGMKHVDLKSQTHTNAMVLSNIISNQNTVVEVGSAIGKTLLEKIVRMETSPRVILDVGAQFLELTNQQVAEKWLDLTRHDYEDTDAVVFCSAQDELLVLDREEGRVEALQTSPLRNQLDRCFIYLDQSHTRGIDLVLPDSYAAAVTLGAHLTKDKLTQACMRMRKLGQGQTVVFCVPEEIGTRIRCRNNPDEPTRSISERERIQVTHIVEWAISETWDDTRRSMALWASQGRRFEWQKLLWDDAHDDGSLHLDYNLAIRFLEDETQSLESRYCPNFVPEPSVQNLPNLSHNLALIAERCATFETDERGTSGEEEQERELEPEMEREPETERQEILDPSAHRESHALKSFIKSGEVPESGLNPAFESLETTSAARHFDVESFPKGIFVTLDFAATLKNGHTREGGTDRYQRNVEWIVTSHNAQKKDPLVVIISPYEAERYFNLIESSNFVTLHLYAPRQNKSHDAIDDLRLFRVSGAAQMPPLPRKLKIQLNLFAGQLYFSDFPEYADTADFLNLTWGSPTDTETNVDGFIPVESRHRITPYKTQFMKSPVQFLKVLMTSIRYNGRSIDKTHVGRMLNGVVLGEEDFEPRVKRKAEEQLGRDSEM